jgi:hypothetical protein
MVPVVDPNQIPVWLYVLLFAVSTLIAGIPALIAVVIAAKKAPVDIKKVEKEATSEEVEYTRNIQLIASGATAENLGLRTELTNLRKDFDALNARYETDLQTITEKYDKEIRLLKEEHSSEMLAIKKSLEDSRVESKAWREYSSRLINQMKAEMPDVSPIPFEPRKRRPNQNPGGLE